VLPGVRRTARIGSITTTTPHPNDIDRVVAVTDGADVARLARCPRRLHGRAQRLNRGAVRGVNYFAGPPNMIVAAQQMSSSGMNTSGTWATRTGGVRVGPADARRAMRGMVVVDRTCPMT
jgi:hypothetical protein